MLVEIMKLNMNIQKKKKYTSIRNDRTQENDK